METEEKSAGAGAGAVAKHNEKKWTHDMYEHITDSPSDEKVIFWFCCNKIVNRRKDIRGR